jgi:hypothetical protein
VGDQAPVAHLVLLRVIGVLLARWFGASCQTSAKRQMGLAYCAGGWHHLALPEQTDGGKPQAGPVTKDTDRAVSCLSIVNRWMDPEY